MTGCTRSAVFSVSSEPRRGGPHGPWPSCPAAQRPGIRRHRRLRRDTVPCPPQSRPRLGGLLEPGQHRNAHRPCGHRPQPLRDLGRNRAAQRAAHLRRNRTGGLAIAHNGNLTNAHQVRKELVRRGAIFQSTSDTEIIVHLVALSSHGDIPDRLVDALKQVVGAYSLSHLPTRQ